MAKKKVNADETTEKVVEETAEVKVEETAEVKAENPVKKKKDLKTKHFQNPDDLVDFFNQSGATLVAIVAFDRFQALYYYEK